MVEKDQICKFFSKEYVVVVGGLFWTKRGEGYKKLDFLYN